MTAQAPLLVSNNCFEPACVSRLLTSTLFCVAWHLLAALTGNSPFPSHLDYICREQEASGSLWVSQVGFCRHGMAGGEGGEPQGSTLISPQSCLLSCFSVTHVRT